MNDLNNAETEEKPGRLKGRGTAVLAFAVVGLGIWVSILDGRLEKAESKANWLEARMSDATTQIKNLEYRVDEVRR